MKIKLLVSCGGIDFNYMADEVVDVDDALGKDLVQAGHAEEVKNAKTKKSDATSE